ncbi:hypothetical protein ROJ8625_01317 [Roseivivax jejudonensis]|uniref:DUF4112 domain-containing protein n=1 Tax=Roseivivax jejudonensis TaxID=1529041 RepID=A0A1X6YT47_9RHOB|nr:DUF4112 domain-containing protein [Roseivivax jejudonensis]SLN29762.1 hypothetical protein ROJ8625_01317 [Roseivivax jejudonensis]
MREVTPETELARVARIERLATRMDRAFRVPGTRIRFGWDGVLGLVPGIGDTLALAPAAYILHSAYEMKVPTPLLARMGVNVAVDWAVGLVPIIGDLLDVGYKSNTRNAALLREHVESRHNVIRAAAE